MAINLGDRVKDRISGLSGIVVGRSEWLYGCVRLIVQPEESKDGKPADGFNVDEPQAELIKAGVITRPAPEAPAKHGPRVDATRRAAATKR